MKSKIKNIIKITLFIVLTIICILLLKSLIVNKYIKLFGFSSFQVITGSMKNTINIGDIVIVKEKNNYNIGDIIAFKEEEQLIIHRIIQMNEEGITTKGDANNKEDSPIKKDQIIGKEVLIIKEGNKFKIAIIVILLIICVIMLIFKSGGTNAKQVE